MDQERKIRFLYPPFILIISVLVGLYFDNTKSIIDIVPQLANTNDIYEIILVLLGGSIIILVLGFIIGIITMNVLRLFFYLFKKRHFAAADALNNEAYDKIAKLLLPEDKIITKQQRMYAAVSFEHSIIPKRIHEWLVRRWNSFNVSVNSVSALVASTIIFLILDIKIGWGWIVFAFITGAFLVIHAVNSWNETLRMTEFHANCDQKKIKKFEYSD